MQTALTMTSFGSRLRAIRVSLLGLTRLEFSKKFGVAEPLVKALEMDHIQIKESLLKKLQESLRKNKIEATNEWLLSGYGRSPFSEITYR